MRKLNIPKFNISNLTVFVSLIVSICALATSLMQALIMKDQFKVMVEQQKLMSEQYKASVWARIELGADIYASDRFMVKLFVRNPGTGPAIIESVRITYKNKSYKYWRDIFNELGIKHDFSITQYQLRQKTLIAGETLNFFQIDDKDCVIALINNLDKFKIEICYKSVYGAIFLHTGSQKNNAYELETHEVKQNPIKDNEQFLE
jgi:hypothetical protein